MKVQHLQDPFAKGLYIIGRGMELAVVTEAFQISISSRYLIGMLMEKIVVVVSQERLKNGVIALNAQIKHKKVPAC